MAVATFNKAGDKATAVAKLDKAVFAVEVTNHELIKSVYDAYLANGRENLAVTKTRGLVRGGGRKPWKQKGTGRARFGSSRNPIWRTGGIVFGPTGEENYSKHVNTKAKRLALRQALSLAAAADKLIVIEDIDTTTAKTSVMAALLHKTGANGRVLVAVADKTDSLQLAVRNLPEVTLVQSSYVNVYDAINADKIVLTNAALSEITKRLGGDN